MRIRRWGIQAAERDQPGGPAATRALARCWAGEKDIAEAMVTSGHAADWPKYSGGFYAAR